MDNKNRAILRWGQRMLRETMCHVGLTRTRGVVEVLEEVVVVATRMGEEVEVVVVVATRMGDTKLMINLVETVTKGTTTTTEEGDAVVVVEEMAIHTTTTKTPMLLLRLSFCACVFWVSLFRYLAFML